MRLLRFRRFALPVFALIYSVGSTGIALRAHFCHGEFYSVDFAYDASHTGCGCQKKSEPCCKDVTGFFGVEDDQHGGTGCVIPQNSPTAHDIFHAQAFGPRFHVPSRACMYPIDDPPEKFVPPIYLLIRNFRN